MQFKKLAGAILAVSLMSGAVQANIASDLAKDAPMSVVYQNAVDEGLTIEQIMQQIAKIDTGLLDAMVTAAIAAGADPQSVYGAATASGANPESALAAAILGDPTLDPTTLSATAAGPNPQGNLPQTPDEAEAPELAQLGPGTEISPAFQPPGFPNQGNGGGGGNPSPN